MTDFNLEARYPDEKFSFRKRCTREFTLQYLKSIKEMKEGSRKDSVIRDVKKYIDVLRAKGISVDRALLFGSCARGTAREESDVALVSSAFTGDRFMDRRKIVPFRRNINTSVEPMPFRPEDFAEDGILVEEIRSHGEEIVLGFRDVV